MENKLKEIALRIRELRQITGLTPAEMAAKTGVDVTDILKGSSPTLSSFSINKKGDGLPILRRRGKKVQKTGCQLAAGFGAVDQCSWIIMRMIVRSVSRIPSLASVPMLRIVFSTPLTTMPSPP